MRNALITLVMATAILVPTTAQATTCAPLPSCTVQGTNLGGSPLAPPHHFGTSLTRTHYPPR